MQVDRCDTILFAEAIQIENSRSILELGPKTGKSWKFEQFHSNRSESTEIT